MPSEPNSFTKIHFILTVNGTVGEGALLSIEERKSVLEIWMDVARALDIFVMVHVGAANMNGVIELVSRLIYKFIKNVN